MNAARELRALRAEWRTWNRGGPHIDFGLVCPARCGLPGCEACAMAAYRRDRMDELKVRAAIIKGSA